MSSWRTIKLKEVCQRITVGHVGSMAGEYQESGIPFLRSMNITPFQLSRRDLKFIDRKFHERLKKSALKPGDVAVVRTGYPGTACVIPEELGEANCSDLVLITPGPELNPYFLAAIFNSTFGKDLVGGNLVGAAQQHFNITTAKELKLLMPPKGTQDKIAAILTAYDDLIEVNKRRIALLEKMAEELYREWFVRLRFPGYQDTRFVKGVPEGWKPVTVESLVKRMPTGKLYDQKSALPEGAVPILDQGRNGVIGYHNDQPGAQATLDAPLIVFANHTCYQRMIFHPFSAIQNVLPFVPKDSNIDIYWLHYATKDLIRFSEYRGHWPAFMATQIYRPESNLTKQFGLFVKPLIHQAYSIDLVNRNLSKTRDLLLPRLISGKLSVEDLDIQFPPSMSEDTAVQESPLEARRA